MAKSSSSIAGGLFGAAQFPALADASSLDTPVVVTTTNEKQQEDITGNRRPVEVEISGEQPQETSDSNKKAAEDATRSNYNKEAAIGRSKSREDWGNYQTHQGNHSGQKTRRMCVAMPDDAYRFIRREAIKHGMTYGEYIYSLAQAAAKGEVTL